MSGNIENFAVVLYKKCPTRTAGHFFLLILFTVNDKAVWIPLLLEAFETGQ
jgi:hypothetical protein